jgi:hypothetical protein
MNTMAKERFEYVRDANNMYVCPHCDKVTEKQSTMHMHYKAKHSGELPHECATCHRRFSQKQILDLHIRARHLDTLEDRDTFEVYDCPLCPFSSNSVANRIIHFTRKHCKEYVDDLKDGTGNEISCTECQRTFKSSTAFYYHVAKCLTTMNITVPHLAEVM